MMITTKGLFKNEQISIVAELNNKGNQYERRIQNLIQKFHSQKQSNHNKILYSIYI